MVQGIVTPHNSNTPEEERNLYQTPNDLFLELNRIYGPFHVDGAANAGNHKCPLWFGPGSPFLEDALSQPWEILENEQARGFSPLRVFCNPPWSRGNIYAFMRKGLIEHQAKRANTTFLLPATTDVSWFHDMCWDSPREQFHPWLRVFFLTPRVRYVRPDGKVAENPGIGSMIVSYRSWSTPWNLGSISNQQELLNTYEAVLTRAGI